MLESEINRQNMAIKIAGCKNIISELSEQLKTTEKALNISEDQLKIKFLEVEKLQKQLLSQIESSQSEVMSLQLQVSLLKEQYDMMFSRLSIENMELKEELTSVKGKYIIEASKCSALESEIAVIRVKLSKGEKHAEELLAAKRLLAKIQERPIQA
jgi:hypothetical protein